MQPQSAASQRHRNGRQRWGGDPCSQPKGPRGKAVAFSVSSSTHGNASGNRRSPPPWQKPEAWFRLVVLAFVGNLLLAVRTIEHHSRGADKGENKAKSPPVSLTLLGLPEPLATAPSQRKRPGKQPLFRFSEERGFWHRFLLQEEHLHDPRKNHKNHHAPAAGATGNATGNATRYPYGERKRERGGLRCGERKGGSDASAPATDTKRNKHKRPGVHALPPLGFQDAVRAYVDREREKERGQTPSFPEVDPLGSEGSSQGSSQGPSQGSSPRHLRLRYCSSPPQGPSCSSANHTVLVYSGGRPRGNNSENDDDDDESDDENAYWRNLVVTTMKFLARPSVERVNLVLRRDEGEDAANEQDKQDTRNGTTTAVASVPRNKYRARIEAWRDTDAVRVVESASLFGAIDGLDVPSEGLVWVDAERERERGSSPGAGHRGGVRGTRRDTAILFRAWRELPSALVLPSGPPPGAAGAPEPVVCPLSSLHGTVMHKHYLCYLNHPVVGSDLRRRLAADKKFGWETAETAMGMLLLAIGEAYVLVQVEDHHRGERPGGGPVPGPDARELSEYFFGCGGPCAPPGEEEEAPVPAIPRWNPPSEGDRECK